MEAAMPGVTIVDVPADDVITYGGAIHCVTKTIPVLAWPSPCTDGYDFNDEDCTTDSGDPNSGDPNSGDPSSGDPSFSSDEDDEEKVGCGCSSTGQPGSLAILCAFLLPWYRRRW